METSSCRVAVVVGLLLLVLCVGEGGCHGQDPQYYYCNGNGSIAKTENHRGQYYCNGETGTMMMRTILMEEEYYYNYYYYSDQINPRQRRFLEEYATSKKKYISPGALKPDQPVCDGTAGGEAYSKNGRCIPPESNPYNRGCSKYYRCRGDA